MTAGTKKKFISVDVLRVLACLLIINFHCMNLYPQELSHLSFGGDLGNNSFFLVSGFLLVDSVRNAEVKDFGRWIAVRYLKILPMCFFFNLLGYIFIKNRVLVPDVFHSFIFPTVYWFTGALILFYPLFFLIQKVDNQVVTLIAVIIPILLHLYFDSLWAEKFFIGFIAMLSGGYLKVYLDREDHRDMSKTGLLLAPVSFCIFAALKIAFSKGVGNHRLIHLLIGIMTVVTAGALLAGLYDLEKNHGEKELFGGPVRSVISLISSMTLSVYLTHCFMVYTMQGYFARFKFPLSIAAFVICAFSVAYCVYRIDDLVRKKLSAKKKAAGE